MRKRKLPPQEGRCQMGAGTEEQCRAPRRRNSEYCFFHEVEKQEERIALGEKLMRLKWLNHSDLHEFLVQTTEAVSRKKLDPQRAYALACLVKLIEENLPKVDSELREHQRLGWAGMEPDEVESLAWRLQKEEKNIAKAMEEEEKGGAEEE